MFLCCSTPEYAKLMSSFTFFKKAYHQEILDEDDEDEDEANNDDGSVSPKEVTELCSLEF